jgi:transposase-like protein
MDCVACGSAAAAERRERSARGYRRFRCRDCGKQFNERSGGLLNHTQYPSDVIGLVVLWRLRYRLTLRDLAEMFLIRGIVFSHEAVRDWEAKLAPVLAGELRRRRHGKGAGIVPERVTTDGYCSHPRAIRSTYGRRVAHRTNAFKNNGLEQDHRGVKGRTRCMRGFKSFNSAECFCRSYDELRNFFRSRTRHNQHISARRRRLLYFRHVTAAFAILNAA